MPYNTEENYSDIDLVLFVADKIKWDQEGKPPYLFYIAYGFVYQLHGANDFKCFFNRFIKINYYGLPQMLFCCL